jgi:uncharacterized protein YbjT (DUF2867 family)
MKIVVIGGTGLIGSKVVSKLNAAGHQAVAAAPNTGVNTLTGEGLAEVLTGAEVVVDLANSPTFDEAAIDFFKTAGQNVAEAERAAGVGHHIALSVVGTEKMAVSPYFLAKQAQEKLIRDSGIPYTIIHATQFMEFLRGIGQSAVVGDEIHLSHAYIQPMAAEDVADAVAAVAIAEPANRTVEIGGPEKFHLDEIIGKVMAFDGDTRPIVVDAEARYFGLRLDDDSLIPGPDAKLGSTRFDWWLENVPPPPKK